MGGDLHKTYCAAAKYRSERNYWIVAFGSCFPAENAIRKYDRLLSCHCHDGPRLTAASRLMFSSDPKSYIPLGLHLPATRANARGTRPKHCGRHWQPHPS